MRQEALTGQEVGLAAASPRNKTPLATPPRMACLSTAWRSSQLSKPRA